MDRDSDTDTAPAAIGQSSPTEAIAKGSTAAGPAMKAKRKEPLKVYLKGLKVGDDLLSRSAVSSAASA